MVWYIICACKGRLRGIGAGRKKGADRSAPFKPSQVSYLRRCYLAGGAPAALPNDANCSLPTNPKAETPEPLMILSTLAAVS